MYKTENALYIILLISSVVLMAAISVCVFFIVRFYKKSLSLQKELDKRTLLKLEREQQRIAARVDNVLSPLLRKIRVYVEQQIARDKSLETVLLEALSLTNRAIMQTDGLSVILPPPKLKKEGLIAAIRDLCNFIESNYGVVIVIHCAAIPRLAVDAELHLFRITEEVIQNVATHARASQVFLTIITTGKMVKMIINDDGIGLNMAELKKDSTALGLRAILAHAEQIKAEVYMEGNEQEGTTFLLEMPVN